VISNLSPSHNPNQQQFFISHSKKEESDRVSKQNIKLPEDVQTQQFQTNVSNKLAYSEIQKENSKAYDSKENF